MPTSKQVIDYVTKHPGCKSKDIALALGCPKQEINKRSGAYPGIYSIPEITHQDFKHYPAGTALDDEQSCIYDIPPPAEVNDSIVDDLVVKNRELQDKNDALEAALERLEARLERLTLEYAERMDHLDDRTTLLEAKSASATKLMPKLKPKPVE